MGPQVLFGGLVREITYEQSNRWHGIVEEGRLRLVRLRSIAKTLKGAKLGLQGIELEAKHIEVGGAAGDQQF
jgi:hypothetical protein